MRSTGLTILVQLSLHLSCLCESSLIFNLQDFQVREKAVIAIASGSGCQDTYLSNCLLILVVKRSVSGFPNFLIIL